MRQLNKLLYRKTSKSIGILGVFTYIKRTHILISDDLQVKRFFWLFMKGDQQEKKSP